MLPEPSTIWSPVQPFNHPVRISLGPSGGHLS
jgi:hypothetical protein